MSIERFQIYINQLAGQIETRLNEPPKAGMDNDECCRLLDAKEYLRRAWWALEGRPFDDNDTTIETQRRLMKDQ